MSSSTTVQAPARAEHFERRSIKGGKRTVQVAVVPMTQDEAREAYPYRPFSKYAESRFGGGEIVDDYCLLLNGLAQRCSMCDAPTKKEYLNLGICPDCDGRSEFNGVDPHQR